MVFHFKSSRTGGLEKKPNSIFKRKTQKQSKWRLLTFVFDREIINNLFDNNSVFFRQKTDKNAINNYRDRYKYSQELKRESQQAVQRKNRKNRASRHRKEAYSDHLAPSGSDDETLEIPTIEHIRLSGTTRRKLLERRISLLKDQDMIAHLESRFSDRNSRALNPYHPSSSHSSKHTRTITAAIPENETEDSEYGATKNNVQIVRKAARNHRTSVLNKAERLLHERKRQEIGSSSEADTEDSPRLSANVQRQRLARPSTYVARRSRSRSLSSEREYVNVPEVLDSAGGENSALPQIQLDNDDADDRNNNIIRSPSNDYRRHRNQFRTRHFLKSAAQVRNFHYLYILNI